MKKYLFSIGNFEAQSIDTTFENAISEVDKILKFYPELNKVMFTFNYDEFECDVLIETPDNLNLDDTINDVQSHLSLISNVHLN